MTILETEALDALDTIMATNVMGFKRESNGWEPGDIWRYPNNGSCLVSDWKPTRDDSLSAYILAACMERLEAANNAGLIMRMVGGNTQIKSDGYFDEIVVEAGTQSLAICHFARALFTRLGIRGLIYVERPDLNNIRMYFTKDGHLSNNRNDAQEIWDHQFVAILQEQGSFLEGAKLEFIS